MDNEEEARRRHPTGAASKSRQSGWSRLVRAFDIVWMFVWPFAALVLPSAAWYLAVDAWRFATGYNLGAAWNLVTEAGWFALHVWFVRDVWKSLWLPFIIKSLKSAANRIDPQ